MKHLVPSLSALLLAGAATAPLSAAAIKDEKADLSLAVKGQLQTRLYVGASGEDETGADYNPVNGASGSPEALRFMIRRARLAFDAAYGDGWFGNMTIRADNTTSTSNSTGETIYFAYAGKSFKASGVEHIIEGGLDKPFTLDSSTSSSAYMLPFGAQTMLEGARGVGAQYRLRSEFVNAGVSLMNNSTTGSFTANGTGEEPSDGYFYSARVEVAPGKGFMPKKTQESYLGEDGTTLLIGLEYLRETAKFSGTATAWTETDTTWWGPDINLHWNALTVTAAYRMQSSDGTGKEDGGAAPADTEVDGNVWTIGAAYAFRTTAGVFEPAARLSMSDKDKDNDNEAVAANFADLDAAGSVKQSGTTIEAGVNWYIKGHGNKLQLAYVHFTGEDAAGGDNDSAHAVVLQHNLTF